MQLLVAASVHLNVPSDGKHCLLVWKHLSKQENYCDLQLFIKHLVTRNKNNLFISAIKKFHLVGENLLLQIRMG